MIGAGYPFRQLAGGHSSQGNGPLGPPHGLSSEADGEAADSRHGSFSVNILPAVALPALPDPQTGLLARASDGAVALDLPPIDPDFV